MPRIMSMRVRRMGPIFQQYITGFKDELRKTKVIVWGQASFKEIGLKGGAREKKKTNIARQVTNQEHNKYIKCSKS